MSDIRKRVYLPHTKLQFYGKKEYGIRFVVSEQMCRSRALGLRACVGGSRVKFKNLSSIFPDVSICAVTRCNFSCKLSCNAYVGKNDVSKNDVSIAF